MKKLLSLILFCTAFLLLAQEAKYLYTIELTPDNLADIDPRQNVCLKKIGKDKNAILVSKSDSSWLDLTRELCLGKEIVVTYRYKAAEKGKVAKNFRAVLRYAKGDVYCDCITGKATILPVGEEWRTGSCSMKFPAELEEAMITFHANGADVLVTDIKVMRK